jgi:thiol-disulfide isomerase/thioredoxin
VNRRHLLVGGTAAAALGAGVLLGLHKAPAQPEVTPDALWGMRLDTPGGQSLDMHALKGQPVLLNFWATWCPPCVKEMPLLNAFYQQHRKAGWRVVGLAVDSAAAVQEFLKQHPVDFDIALSGFAGIALSRSLGNTHGSLPFTVLFDRQTLLRQRKLGSVNEADLLDWGALPM